MYSIWVISYNMFDFKLTLKPDAGAVVDDDKHEDDGDDMMMIMMMMVVMILMKGLSVASQLKPSITIFVKIAAVFWIIWDPLDSIMEIRGNRGKKENIRGQF